MTGLAAQEHALAGLLVVEAGARVGAAVCGSMLAQLGADVVYIEPEECRLSGHKGNYHDVMAAGKHPLRAGDAPDLMRRLIAAADVVLVSSDSGSDLPARKPHQIACDITAFGKSGPMASAPWTDPQIQALTGMAHTTGLADAAPLATQLPIVEYLSGLNATVACLAALRSRRIDGAGQGIDIALYDSAVVATSSFLARIIAAEDPPPLGRIGNAHPLSAPWNAYHALDGWVLVCTGSDLQWQRLCGLIGRPELGEAEGFQISADRVARVSEVDVLVQEWVGRTTVKDCVATLSDAGIAVGPITPINDYPREDNLTYRGLVRESGGKWLPGSPLRMSKTPGRIFEVVPKLTPLDQLEALATRPKAATSKPSARSRSLSGLRVVEIGHYTTAPVSARVLGSLGADVIKVEPPTGEAARGWAPNLRGQSLFYTLSNSDKQAICLDLNNGVDRGRLEKLLASADVLIENLKPQALARKGFDAAALERINPDLVSCAISGFGADSLYPGRPAFDTVIQAMSGLMDQVRCGDIPVKTSISVADVMGAGMASIAVLAALEWRDRGGTGQAIDLSMQDILAWATAVAWNGGADRLPNFDITGTEAGGYILSLAESGISPGEVPVCTPVEMLRSAQTEARKLAFRVFDERGEWPALSPALWLDGTPPEVRRPGPALGRDTATVLGYAAPNETETQETMT